MKKSSYSKVLILVILGLFVSGYTHSQNQPIIVNTQVIPPYSPYFSDYIGQSGDFNTQYSDLILITVQNTDFSNSYQIKLNTRISNNDNISIIQNPSYTPSRPISLTPGETRVINLSQLSAYNSNINSNHFSFNGITYNQLSQTGVLPEGMYQVCMQALDYNTSQPLSANPPSGCSSSFMVVHLDPPMITYPMDEMELTVADPQNIQFSWTPPPGGSGTFDYTFRMIEMDNYNNAPEYIMDNTNYSFYREENITTPTLLYDMTKPALDAGKTYAVRVTASDPQNQVQIKNNGHSEVVTFMVKDQTGEDDGGDDDQQEMACGGSCNYDLSSASQSPVTTLANGDTIKAGYYEVVITNAQWSGNVLTGKGKILPTSFLPVPLSASLMDVQVNENHRMIAGKVTAEARDSNFLTSDMLSGVGNQISFPGVSSGDMYHHLNNPGYYISNLQNNMEVALPVGLEAPNAPYRVALVGFNLGASQASFNAALMVKAPQQQNKYLAFGAKNICVNPSGIALSDSAQLELLDDINVKFSDDVKLNLSKYQDPSGTYAVMDCDGFSHISLDGQFRFSPKVIRYENADGTPNETDTVRVDFTTSVTDWSDWLVTLDMAGNNDQKYQLPKMEDYSFNITQAVFDHSDTENDPSIIFPDSYSSYDKNATWQGLFIKEFDMMMPRFIEKSNGDRVQVTASNVLVDNHGVSGFIEAFNPLNKNEGQLGDWAFSVDYFAIELAAGHLDSTAMKGEMIMPVSDSSFRYSSEMSYINESLDYNFFLESTGKVNIPMWYAQMDLYESSSLDVDVANNDVTIEASLNGKLNFDEEIGDIDKVNIKGLEFEQLVVRNKPDYLRLDGAFGLSSSESSSLLGFGANLQGGNDGGTGPGSFSMSLDEISTNEMALTIDMGLNFTGDGDQNSLSGNTSLVISSEFDVMNAEWKNADVYISEVALDASLGIADIDGTISFFKNNPTYGKGFQGELSAKILQSFNVTSNSIFGAVDDYRYWYVDGTISWMPGGIGWAGIGVYGFGGGVFYNMERITMQSPQEVNNEQDGVQFPYQPKEGARGLKATSIVGLQGESSTWNSDATIEVVWLTNGGLSQLSLYGDSYFVQAINDRAQKAKFKGSADITYDFRQSVLSGFISTDINVPAENPVITGNGTTAFHFGPNYWYIKAGEPDDRITLNVEIDEYTFANGTYYMVGSNIPGMPPVPSNIRQYLDYDQIPTRPDEGAIANGAGFAHGLAMDFNLENYDATICWIDARLQAGYDISVMDWSADGVTCNGRSDFGFNKWYAKGQVYFLAQARFYGSHHDDDGAYFRCALGAIAEGGIPNPSGVKGKIKATFSVGPVTWEPEKSFYIGEICTMEVLDDTEPDIENPYEDVEFIALLKPANGDQSVSPLFTPEVEFNYPVDDPQTYTFTDGMGGMASATYRIDYDFFIRENNSTAQVDLETALSDDNKTLNVTLNETMQPETEYVVVVETELKQKQGNSWVTVLDNASNPIRETKSHVFTTSEKKKLADSDIDQTIPVKRQRYFKQNDYPQGKISFTNNLSNFFEQYEDKNIQVKFISHDQTDSHVVDASVSNFEVTFPLPNLQNETIYNLKLLAVSPPEDDSGDGNYAGGSWNSGGSGFGGGNNTGWNFGGGNNFSGGGNFGGGGFNSGGNNYGDFEIDPTVFADVIYDYWFRTSMFNTLNEKLESLNTLFVDEETEPVLDYNSVKLNLKIQGPERFEGYYDNKNHELEFSDINFKLEHNEGIAENFLPDWYLSSVSYPVNSSQSWNTKAKNQVLIQESPYSVFGQEPYFMSGYYSNYLTPTYFDGPLSENNILYGWEPDYSGGGSSGQGGFGGGSGNNFGGGFNLGGLNNFNYGGINFGNVSDEPLTTVMKVEVTLDKEVFMEFKNHMESAVEVAKMFEGGDPDDYESAGHVPMPQGAYKFRIRMNNDYSLSKTIYFNY